MSIASILIVGEQQIANAYRDIDGAEAKPVDAITDCCAGECGITEDRGRGESGSTVRPSTQFVNVPLPTQTLPIACVFS